MSSLSEQEHLNPNEPTYYAPRWLRERPEVRVAPSNETSSEPVRSPNARPAASLDTQLENAVSSALWHPLAPEVIQEPPGLAEEMDRGSALITVAGPSATSANFTTRDGLVKVARPPAQRSIK